MGQTGAAHPGLVLAALLERSGPGEVVAVVSLADGADVLLFRTTEAISSWAPARPVADQIAAAADLPYGTFLTWRGMVTPEPPRRPEPPAGVRPRRPGGARSGSSASSARGTAPAEPSTSRPSRVSMKGGAVDDMDPVARADTEATIATFTVDRLAYSPSPPIVFAVVDFDGGGRFPVELTDVDPDARGHRGPGGHDVPQAVHRGRDPRLLLEGQAGRGPAGPEHRPG